MLKLQYTIWTMIGQTKHNEFDGIYKYDHSHTQLSKGRIPELDIIKFFGILLVVFGHVTRMYTPVGLITPLESSSVLAITTSIIYSFHMPLFVFVSGMTFGVTCKKKSYQDFTSFARNKVKRLMIPYFVFALFWVLPFMVGFGFRPFLPYLTKGLLLSLDSRHLWYVWMLFNVFLLFWGLRFLLKNFTYPIGLSC